MSTTALIWFGVAVVSALIAAMDESGSNLRLLNGAIAVIAFVLGIAEVTA